MTHIELRDLLVNRIGFKQEVGFTAHIVDANNQLSISGRYFQDEHPTVLLDNILASMPKIPVNDIEFNVYLKMLMERAIILVLSEVFEVTDIQDDLLTCDDTILDNAISKRMAIIVGESILSSTRSSRLDSQNKSILALQLEGQEGKFAGMKEKYEKEIYRVKDVLGQEKMLDVNTLRLPNYDDTDNNPFL